MENVQGGQESMIQVDQAGGIGSIGGRDRWAKGREWSGRTDARGPRAVRAKQATGLHGHRFR